MKETNCLWDVGTYRKHKESSKEEKTPMHTQLDVNKMWKHHGTKEDMGTHFEDSKATCEGPLAILDLIARINKCRLLYVLIYSKHL
jgi:hypothetical protein